MTRWEYTVVYAPPGAGPKAIIDLKAAGLEGWKLVSVINGWCYLMRPIVDEDRISEDQMEWFRSGNEVRKRKKPTAAEKMPAAKKPAKPAARKRGAKK